MWLPNYVFSEQNTPVKCRLQGRLSMDLFLTKYCTLFFYRYVHRLQLSSAHHFACLGSHWPTSTRFQSWLPEVHLSVCMHKGLMLKAVLFIQGNFPWATCIRKHTWHAYPTVPFLAIPSKPESLGRLSMVSFSPGVSDTLL